MKESNLILWFILFEIFSMIILTILIIKANKKIKQMECEHKNTFHYVDGEKSKKTCMNCGDTLKCESKKHENKCTQTF